jgi:HipA-like protein
MAELLYGNLYFHDLFAGILRQEPDGRYAFHHDEVYLTTGSSAIADTLPLQIDPIYSASGLHPFFDNLAAEARSPMRRREPWASAGTTVLRACWRSGTTAWERLPFSIQSREPSPVSTREVLKRLPLAKIKRGGVAD